MTTYAGIDWPACTRCERTMLWPPGIARGVCSVCVPPTPGQHAAVAARALAALARHREERV